MLGNNGHLTIVGQQTLNDGQKILNTHLVLTISQSMGRVGEIVTMQVNMVFMPLLCTTYAICWSNAI